MSSIKGAEDLGVSVPRSTRLVVRQTMDVTEEQRAMVLAKTSYNVFNFPAQLLNVDLLSDSGSSALWDRQWATMMLGDESYGRNRGYYLLMDTFRDVFERGDDRKNLIRNAMANDETVESLVETVLAPNEGGFVNGGEAQLERPNAFITPQGRCAEFLLFSSIKEVLEERHGAGKPWFFLSNGWFDTTGAHVANAGFTPINLFDPMSLLADFDKDKIFTENPFKGNMNTELMEKTILEKGAENVPLIVLTITNNSAAGQPVSLKNMEETCRIAKKYDIPLFFDACRFAENAYFIKKYEAGYDEWSIEKIVQKCFTYADGATISLKKDGMANIGGCMFFKDRGVFHRKFSTATVDIGTRIKEKQILVLGNDSYGGLTGRDILALSVGLNGVTNLSYLEERIGLTQYTAHKMATAGIPVVLPPGGHALYIDCDKFFEGTGTNIMDFKGVGLTIELIKRYGIRGCELGPFAFEIDQKPEDQRAGILNIVRFAIPRNLYNREHMDYLSAALAELHQHREEIPKVRISRGEKLRLRHFQSGLEPIYN